jgi:flagellar basal body-associated protein FliL
MKAKTALILIGLALTVMVGGAAAVYFLMDQTANAPPPEEPGSASEPAEQSSQTPEPEPERA